MSKLPLPTELPRERAFLIGVALRDNPGLLSLDDSLDELALLADTAGMVVVGTLTQKLARPNAATFIGSGKVSELKNLVEETVAESVIFDDELSPRHQRELEKALGENVKVLDRTALILDIFAQHAFTREGALQVELAQYEYRLPRLTRQWTHLARQAGGGGGRTGPGGGVGLRGPGETQLEVDRRDIGRRIDYLRASLEKVRAHRGRHRKRRQRASIPVVAFVGYTNAGKSTLLNALTDSNVHVANQLFATLDPTTRRVSLRDGQEILMTDTVGFIQKLPTALVAAFRATLEEISEANLLLHLVDATHPNAQEQAEAVVATLDELEIENLPIVTVFNKTDILQDRAVLGQLQRDYPDSVEISALRRVGLDTLLEHISRLLDNSMSPIDVTLPYQEGHLVSLFYDNGQVDSVDHTEEGVQVSGKLPHRLLDLYRQFQTPSP